MAPLTEGEEARLDDAARAGWLYYVAGHTQDEIARELGVSRQSAQRLVSLAVSAGLVKVRLDHPIARCMERARALRDRFGLGLVEVTPSAAEAPGLLAGVAAAAGAEIERVLREEAPRIVSLGTGRALRAAVEHVALMERPQHRVVSRLGNMMRDGSASPFNAVIRLAERTGARHYPMGLPAMAQSPEEVALLRALPAVAGTLELAARADVSFVGVGGIGPGAPVVQDGFVTPAEIAALEAAGAVGEITSWAFDARGALVGGLTNDRVPGAPVEAAPSRPVVGVAVGPAKVAAIAAALEGRLLSGLVTDEATAAAVLKMAGGGRARPGGPSKVDRTAPE